MFYFLICFICYLCCVFAVRAGGLVAGSGPPAVSLRRLLCLAVVLVACRASVAGSFGSCRACGQLSASSGWFWGSFCFGAGGADVNHFQTNFCASFASSSGPLAVGVGGSSQGLGLYRLLLFGVLLGWRGARAQPSASTGWFSILLSLRSAQGQLWAFIGRCSVVFELCASSGWFSGLLCLRAGGKHRPRTRREDSETQES